MMIVVDKARQAVQLEKQSGRLEDDWREEGGFSDRGRCVFPTMYLPITWLGLFHSPVCTGQIGMAVGERLLAERGGG